MSDNQKSLRGKKPLREKPILFGFVIQKERPRGGIGISIRWGRITIALLALALTGWVSITGALFVYLKHVRDFETIHYTDALLFHKKELRRKMGDHHIEESIAELKAGNQWDAFRLLNFGVARSPGNLKGRKYIAEFYEVVMKRPSIAADYMIEGLEYEGLEDIEYIKKLIALLLRNQMDKKVQEIADTHLPEEPELTDINRMLALGAANANYQLGNYDRAEEYLLDYRLIESLDGLLISSKISWDRGNRTAAATKLEQSLNRHRNARQLLMQLCLYYREIGNIDKARRYAILYSVNEPLNYEPRLELLYIYNKSGDFEREKEEIERMFDQFGKDKNALIEFANYAAKTGNVELAKRIQAVAIENELDIGLFTLMLLEAHIFSKDYDGILDLSDKLIEQQSEWLTERWAAFNSMRAVAAFATGRPDFGEVYLQNFLEERNNTANSYLNIANYFLDIDRMPQARKILVTAYQLFPGNQKILSELIRIELKLGITEELNERLTRLLKMRRPQMSLLAKAYRELGSDRFIFTENRDTLLLQIGSILRENNQSLTSLEGLH